MQADGGALGRAGDGRDELSHRAHARRYERDLASCPHSKASTVTVLLNRAAGRFAARATYATGAHPRELEAADLNGDGKLELLSANATSVSVLPNRGDGTLEARRDYPTGRSASLRFTT